jgi:hypothetical protein
MGTTENLAKIEEEIRQARRRLEALAERAVTIQNRLRADAPFIVSLDRLSQQEARPTPAPRPRSWEGDDGKLLADAWEISLIGDDNK